MAGPFFVLPNDQLTRNLRDRATGETTMDDGNSPRPAELYSDLPASVVITLSEIVNGGLLNYPQKAVGALDSMGSKNRILRTLAEGPTGAAVRVGAAGQAALSGAAQSARQDVVAHGGNPDPSTRIKGQFPVRQPMQAAMGAVNPMAGALAGMAPENVPMDASVSRSQAAAGTGEVARQGLEMEAGMGAMGAMMQAEQQAQRAFNVGRIIQEMGGAAMAGFSDKYIQDYANPDGTYSPAETYKHALEMGATYGLGGALMSSLGQTVRALRADTGAKALRRFDAISMDSKEIPMDALSGLPSSRGQVTLGMGLGGADTGPKPSGPPQPKGRMNIDRTGAPLQIPDNRATTVEQRVGSRGPAPEGDFDSGMRAERIMKKPAEPAGPRKLSDVERQTLIDAVGRDKATRFGKKVFELDDDELAKVAMEERANATRAAATAGTVREEQPIRPTPDAKLQRRKTNLAMIEAVHKSLSFEDVAALSKTSPEYVAGADPRRLQEWISKNKAELQKTGAAAQAANRAMARPRNYATAGEQRTVSDLLAKHGMTPQELAYAMNLDFEAPASGIPSADSINTVHESQMIKPGDVFRFDAKGLSDNLSKGSIGRSVRYLKGVAADLQNASPELQAQFPPTMEGAVKYLNAQRAEAFSGMPVDVAEEMKQRKLHGDKINFAEEYAGTGPDAIEPPLTTKRIGETVVDPEKLYTVKYKNDAGEDAIAKMYGDKLLQSHEAGIMKDVKAEEVPHPDPERNDALNSYLGSGLGAAQPLYDKYIGKKLERALGPEGRELWRDTKNRMTPESWSRMILAWEMPTHIMHREPAMGKAIDLAADASGMISNADKKFGDLIRDGKDYIRFNVRYPEAAQELADKLVEWNWQFKQTYRSVEQTKRDADLAGIAMKLDAKGQEMLKTVYDQIGAIRSFSQQELVAGLKEAAKFTQRPVEMQKRFTDVIDRKIMANPDYVHFSRKGDYRVAVSKNDLGTVHLENFESLADAKAGLKKLQAKFGADAVYRMEDYTSNVFESHTPRGVKTGTLKPRPTHSEEQAILEMLDVDRVVPAAPDEALENTLQGMAEETIVGKNPTYLSKRQYIPGQKVTLETIFQDFNKVSRVGSRLRAASYVRNQKPATLEWIRNGLITRNPKKQSAFLDYAAKYLAMAEKPHTEPMAFGLLRSGLANMELAGKMSFPLVNLTQTLTMTSQVAAGYGPRGIARFMAAHKLASTYSLGRLIDRSTMLEDLASKKIAPEVVKSLRRLSDEGELGPALIEDLASLTPDQRASLEEFLNKGVLGKVAKAPAIGLKYTGKAMTALIAVTERYNRLSDAFTYLGIGHDLGYRGDDLFNFARRGIAKTQLRYNDMWMPMTMRSNPQLLDTVKAAKMFWRYPVEQFLRTSEAIQDSARSVSAGDAKALLKAAPDRRSAARTIRATRDVLGKSRLRAPVAVLGQLALGGAMGLDPTTWLSAAAAGGIGVAGASALEAYWRYTSSHPSTDKILSGYQGADPEASATGLTWDDQTNAFEKRLGLTKPLRDVVHYGPPAVLGMNIGRQTQMSTPLQTVTSPFYAQGRMRDMFEAANEYRMTGDPVKLIGIFGRPMLGGAAPAVESAIDMARTHRVTVARGDKKTAAMTEDFQPYEPELMDYVLTLGRFESTTVADLRNNVATKSAIMRSREQLQNRVLSDVDAYVEQNWNDPDWDVIQEKLEPLNAWNDLAMSKGHAQAVPDLLFNQKNIIKHVQDKFEEVSFADGAPRTPKELADLARMRARKPSTKDALLSEEIE